MTFEPGHKLAPGGARPGAGRKPNFVRARLDRLMRQSVTDQELLDILEVVKASAKSGNPWAVEFYFDRIFGKPGSETDRTIVSLIESIASADGEAQDDDSSGGAGDGEDNPDRDERISAGGSD